MDWSFAKYVGCGNDFIIFDDRQTVFPLGVAFIRRLCHRQYGIGADGLLLLQKSNIADYRMRIFNADGSEAEMCGNGLRCFMHWLSMREEKIAWSIDVKDKIFHGKICGNNVTVEMYAPYNITWNMSLPFHDAILNIHHLNTGVPHSVLFVEDLYNIPFITLVTHLRHHSIWQPHGTNITIVQLLTNVRIKIRTFERGVEAETLACGTGAVAAALAAAYLHGVQAPCIVETSGGAELIVGFVINDQRFSKCTLTGDAQLIFEGSIDTR